MCKTIVHSVLFCGLLSFGLFAKGTQEQSSCEPVCMQKGTQEQSSCEPVCMQKGTQENSSCYCCGESLHPMRISLRHIEPKGVGYREGYTTLEGFFAAPELWNDAWTPFLDVRGHVFNDGKPAVNVGIGARYLSSRIWGMNTYYDYRKTRRKNYNQISAGFESLGEFWDFRINGYLPVGGKRSLSSGARFGNFKGHYLFLSQKFEFAMKSVNAEVGMHVDVSRSMPIYLAAGPYWLSGQGATAWGGEVRAAMDFGQYVRIEGNASYDSIFKWIGQGQIGVTFAFGPKKNIMERNDCACRSALALSDRSLQRVDRNEIIPVDQKHTRKIAIDPATGQPYIFWFVDNTSHSDGTFESPFNTLVAAQNASAPHDIIYVFPGDGTTVGMDMGIVLQESQKLFGAGTDQRLPTTLGSVTIPHQANDLPKITGASNGFIEFSNNNEVSGIHTIIPDGLISGMLCNNIVNTSIHNNILDGSTIVDGDGGSGLISLTNCGGNLNFMDNMFEIGSPSLSGPLFGVHLFSTQDNALYNIQNNTFESPIANGSAGIEFGTNGNPIGNFASITILNNQFTGLGWDEIAPNDFGKAIGGFGFSGTGRVVISQNTFSQTGAFGPAIVRIQVRAGGNIISSITNNTWDHSLRLSEPSVLVNNVAASSSSCVTLRNNVSDSTPPAYILDNSSGGNFTANVSNNIGSVQEDGTITSGTCP